MPGILRKLSRTHRLIWTSRSYILHEALASTKLREVIDDFPGELEVLVEVNKYDPIEIALMVYNHAKCSGLSREAKEFLKSIVQALSAHPYITPERIRRVIMLLEEYKEPFDSKSPFRSKETGWKEIDDFLTNPGERLMRAYDSLSESERQMLLALLSLGSNVRKERLRDEYERRTHAF